MLAALIGVLLLVFAGSALAHGGDDDGPGVESAPASEVSDTGALLRASVDPDGKNTSYHFEYGPTAAYGSRTADAALGKPKGWRAVSARVEGLAPAGTYHYRLVATSSDGTSRSADRSFTTLAAGVAPEDPVDPADPDARPEGPTLGSTVGVRPGRGTVRVRPPGGSTFVPLAAGQSLPVGTVVDARDGAVALTAALPRGESQTGRFGGGRFAVRQRPGGMVDLYLRGRVCPRGDAGHRNAAGRRATAGRPTAGAARAARSPRRLWGRDRGGRFRTHGRHSHATVRGTRWLVQDRCAGTLTVVTEGEVVLRDLGLDRRRIVRAGERYLARPRP